jgi:hypothetical protein
VPNDTEVLGSDRANGDGCGSASRRRRRRHQRINAVNRVTPTTPATMEPAIAPVCDLCCFELGLEDVLDDGWFVEGTVGVASGES